MTFNFGYQLMENLQKTVHPPLLDSHDTRAGDSSTGVEFVVAKETIPIFFSAEILKQT